MLLPNRRQIELRIRLHRFRQDRRAFQLMELSFEMQRLICVHSAFRIDLFIHERVTVFFLLNAFFDLNFRLPAIRLTQMRPFDITSRLNHPHENRVDVSRSRRDQRFDLGTVRRQSAENISCNTGVRPASEDIRRFLRRLRYTP